MISNLKAMATGSLYWIKMALSKLICFDRLARSGQSWIGNVEGGEI